MKDYKQAAIRGADMFPNTKPYDRDNAPVIMIVEDNYLNMKLFRDLLACINCKIVSTHTAYNAIELTRTYKPDVILMDIQLDGISGVDLISFMKNDSELKHIPIVAISAFAMQGEQETIRAAGCDDYLPKPISIEHFFAIVTSYCKAYDSDNTSGR